MSRGWSTLAEVDSGRIIAQQPRTAVEQSRNLSATTRKFLDFASDSHLLPLQLLLSSHELNWVPREISWFFFDDSHLLPQQLRPCCREHPPNLLGTTRNLLECSYGSHQTLQQPRPVVEESGESHTNIPVNFLWYLVDLGGALYNRGGVVEALSLIHI